MRLSYNVDPLKAVQNLPVHYEDPVDSFDDDEEEEGESIEYSVYVTREVTIREYAYMHVNATNEDAAWDIASESIHHEAGRLDWSFDDTLDVGSYDVSNVVEV